MPIALNCWVVPTAILVLAGVIAMDTNVGGGEGSESFPPPHPLMTGKSISNAMPKLASFVASIFILFLLFFITVLCKARTLPLIFSRVFYYVKDRLISLILDISGNS